MTRSLDQIREQEGLIISPDLVSSDRASVSRRGLMLSIYSYETGGYRQKPNLAGAVLWLWLTLVGTGFALWWLGQGNEIGVYAVAAMIGLDAYAIFCVIKGIVRGREKPDMTYALNISMGNEYGMSFFESRDRAEVEAVRAEVERVFALEAP